jgi:hypothetical protein
LDCGWPQRFIVAKTGYQKYALPFPRSRIDAYPTCLPHAAACYVQAIVFVTPQPILLTSLGTTTGKYLNIQHKIAQNTVFTLLSFIYKVIT